MSENYSSFFRLSHACYVLFLSAAVSVHAQTVSNVTGTITSTKDVAPYQALNIQLQGSNFSLNAVIDSDNLVKATGGPEVITINPAGTTSDTMPTIDSPGSNNGTLMYNGSTYNNLQISLSAIGEPAVTENIYANSPYVMDYYDGTVTSVPFLLTGTVTAYSSPPTPQGGLGTPLFSVNFSGGGLYSGSGSGYFCCVGGPGSGPQGSATYQFLANPIDFHTDTTTKGAWSGPYGGEGYLIANGPGQPPGYAAVSLSQASTYTWNANTSDPRALQDGFDAASGIASAYYGNNFNINIRPTDKNPHTVALYLLDFDNSGRSETLTVTNADTGAVLDTETFANFQNGLYAVWDLQGNIRINVQSDNGSSAVVSGIFFGPPNTVLNPPVGASSSLVTFRGTNATTKGAWQGSYGSSGYSIANGPSSTPATSTMNVTGDLLYTWADETADPRALELNPQGTVGIASAYTQYQSTSFKINVSTTGLLSLYLLDWDNEGRIEKITITDLSTGIVLDTETATSFQGGVYYTWLIQGNVLVTITPVGNSSPAVSGIFFN